MSYTRGTKALIRQATASDFYEQSSVSNVDANPQGPVTEKKAAVNREAERRVITLFEMEMPCWPFPPFFIFVLFQSTFTL